jgi:6-phosphogluconate dehydrogenase
MNRPSAQLAVVGAGVMGKNLALNAADHGIPVILSDRTASKAAAAAAANPGLPVTAATSLTDLAASLARPRRVLLMVPAGTPVDEVLGQLAPLLEPDDVVLDGGNSFFRDTERRGAALAARGLHFLGVGVSGGEEGALRGPSLMPGGPREAYAAVEPILEAIAAKTDLGPCVAWLGPGGAGHFVKMVHNGIEYGDMQIIAEAYDVARRLGGLGAAEIAVLFDGWNYGPLGSFLFEVTARVLRVRDEASGTPLVDLVLDAAGQKGTGRWTVQEALELGVPIPTIAAALDARVISSWKERRVAAEKRMPRAAVPGPVLDRKALVGALADALYGARVTAYAQGLHLIASASAEFGWGIDLKSVVRVWRGGCIIRAVLLDVILGALARDPALPHLFEDAEIAHLIGDAQEGWRRVVTLAAAAGIPAPSTAAGLAYFDAYRTASLPQNLIQAQRDAFGAHTYRRVDAPERGAIHTDWTRETAR